MPAKQKIKKNDQSNGSYITVGKFAEGLNASTPYVRKLIYRRKIAVLRVGRGIRIPVSELHRVIAENTVPAR